MNKLLSVFLTISFVVAGVMYLASDSFIIAGVVLVLFIASSILLFSPMIDKYNKVIDRYHLCYHFINNFIISLSIKKSISGALESTSLSMNEEFKTMYRGLDNMSDGEKIKYLSSYFPFYSYLLFLQVVSIWEDEGGDILKMSNYLLNETRHEEEYISQTSSSSKSKYIENASLWGISLAILVFLRFSLQDFYDKIKGQLIFQLSLIIVAVFTLYAIYKLINRGTEIKIRGYNKNEKII